jgi:hypothetical protein
VQEITDRCPWVHILSTSKYITRSHAVGLSPSSSGLTRGLGESEKKDGRIGFTASHALAWRLKCGILMEVTKKMTMLKECWQDCGKPMKLCSVGKLDQMVEASFVKTTQRVSFHSLALLCAYIIFSQKNCYWPHSNMKCKKQTSQSQITLFLTSDVNLGKQVNFFEPYFLHL